MEEKLLTVDELADHLKVKKSWIYSKTRQTGSDAIPRLPVGKYNRFRLSQVLPWLEKHQKAER